MKTYVKRTVTFVLMSAMLMVCSLGCKATESNKEKIQINVLILPKFEIGEMSGDTPGEALLSDNRFDFSDAYVISTGCAGAAYEYGVMGDVYVITAVVDYDLGHHVDFRDMVEPTDHAIAWYHDDSYDDSTYKILDTELTQKIYDVVKDIEINTTEKTRKAMASAFNDEAWTPMVALTHLQYQRWRI